MVGTRGPLRVGIVGLGRIYDLCILGYRDNDDAEVVALCDPDPTRRAERGVEWPGARQVASLDDLLALDLDLVEVLVPTPAHCDVVSRCLEAGFDVHVQKPMANSLEEADRMLAARDAADRRLRVQENFIFYPPLVKLKAIVESGEIGEPVGLYMKMTGTGVGGWEVPIESWIWQLEQTAAGRGILMFDDGWHKFSVARWLFGDVEEVQAMVGSTRAHPDYDVFMDAPSAVMWRHTNGVQGVFEINLAPDMVMPSSYYTNDERFEVTGRKGFVRVNHCTSRGLQAPSLEVYRDGELRQYHALDDDWGASFRDQTRHALGVFRTGEGDLLWNGEDARKVLAFNLAAIEAGGTHATVNVDEFASRSRS